MSVTVLTNDTMDLTPVTEFDGPALEFDFPSFRIGVAEYREGPTGCTVFYFPSFASATVDIRGGSSLTINTTELHNQVGLIDAICLAGGSGYGLEAATGVAAEHFKMKGYSTGWEDIALVTGAIIYDYHRGSKIYPDKELGRAALRAARPNYFPLGRRGAGASATCGWFGSEPSGQGAAFRQVGPTRIAVFTVVNALGAIVDRQGRIVRGNLDPKTGRRYSSLERIEGALAKAGETKPPHGNTTLTVLVTNQKLEQSLIQLARQVHASLARAIQPFHTMYDGDTLWAVSTNEVENPKLEVPTLGAITSEVAWDAVLSCVQD